MAQAPHRLTQPPDTENELINTIWNGVKPYPHKLRQSMMQNSIFRNPPGLERSTMNYNSKLPSLANRRAACTHLTMERLYGDFRCDVCSRTSELGWVYSCTQDEDVPIQSTTTSFTSDDSHSTELSRSDRSSKDLTLKSGSANPATETSTKLSAWIEQAIKDNHYTPDQILILIAQKQKVLDTAKATLDRFDQSQSIPPTPSTFSTNSTGSTTSSTLTDISIDANPHLPIPTITTVTEPPPTTPTVKPTKLAMYPYCQYRACQLCRPTYRDRTFLCLTETLVLPPPTSLSTIDDGNRPLASLSLMQRIGLRQPKPRKRLRPSLRPSTSEKLYSFDSEGKIVFKKSLRSAAREDARIPEDASADIADAAAIEPPTKGIRESMKRAFRGMITRRESSRSFRVRGKGRESWIEDDRGRGTPGNEDPAEFDLGLWREMDEQLLSEAAGVPLPNVSDFDLGEGGVRGVALTEEAAQVKAADVIMSV